MLGSVTRSDVVTGTDMGTTPFCRCMAPAQVCYQLAEVAVTAESDCVRIVKDIGCLRLVGVAATAPSGTVQRGWLRRVTGRQEEPQPFSPQSTWKAQVLGLGSGNSNAVTVTVTVTGNVLRKLEGAFRYQLAEDAK
jgi:hypothetical protein